MLLDRAPVSLVRIRLPGRSRGIFREPIAPAALQAESEQAKQKAVSYDFTYDNLGVSRNPMNPFYAKADVHPVGGTWIDLGLGAFLAPG
jgi:hypothetical protein